MAGITGVLVAIATAFSFNVGLLYLCNSYIFFGNMHSLYIYRYGWEKIPVGHALQEKRGNMMDEMLFYSVSANVATDIINSRTNG